MNTMNTAIDLAAMGTTVLFLILSVILGLALAVAGAFASGMMLFIFGITEAIAGGRSSHQHSGGGFGAVAIRALLYICACFAAVILAALGHAALGNILAIAGGIALGIALVKMVSRLR